MNRQNFTDALRAIFAAHGKTYSDSVAVSSIFHRVENLPDGFMPWAAERLGDYEKLPSNLGREMVRVLWPEYLEAHPKLRTSHEQRGCPQCTSDVPGWIRGYPERGQCVMFRCGCNHDPRFANHTPMTRRLVVDAGYALEMPGAGWGREQVEAWRGGETYNKPQGFSGVIGRQPEQPRRDHVRELGEAENF